MKITLQFLCNLKYYLGILAGQSFCFSLNKRQLAQMQSLNELFLNSDISSLRISAHVFPILL